MLLIKHFKCKQDFVANFSKIDEISKAHLVTFQANPGYVFIVKSRWTDQDIAVTTDEYFKIVNETVKSYVRPAIQNLIHYDWLCCDPFEEKNTQASIISKNKNS